MSPVRPLPGALAGLLAGLLTACGEGTRLEGSVSPLLDLRYERAEAQGSEEELSVRFITPQGSGENTILKVTAKRENLTFEPGKPIDLTETMGPPPSEVQRGEVSRSVLDEPVRAFPRIARGTLTFEKALQPGAKVPGDFHVTFVQGTDVYSGRTLFGHFEATVP
ncbi:conserved uncharacterized protein [Stigmatella aurantiaca DW4/3-1]|uniref:Conserved uncharacterized protein n=1 Tax=Stigmatella aurantiaca (strain DW4/3-1) TaxID=378806 RepID=E3FWP4_STIAD|nr:conserved uncharacterized protein [Stigmatella aurantiaca DW4/3-1]